MKKALLIAISTLAILGIIILTCHNIATQRFQSSDWNNIFNIRGQINGATASLVNLPDGELVLTTQAHVVDAFAKYPKLKLTWRKYYGWYFKEWSSKAGAFEIEFTPEILWKDDDMDIAFLKVPARLTDACHCQGLQTTPYHEGPAMMVGYPQTGMRTHPLHGQTWKNIGTILSCVEQKQTSGKTWLSGQEYVADLDGLPGNSGSSILDDKGQVIGMVHLLKSWYGEGYAYKNPSINLLPIDAIIAKYQAHRAPVK